MHNLSFDLLVFPGEESEVPDTNRAYISVTPSAEECGTPVITSECRTTTELDEEIARLQGELEAIRKKGKAVLRL